MRNLILMISLLAVLCGCTPDMRYLQGVRADGGVSICVCAKDGHYYSFSVDAGTLKSDAVLEPELEAWKGAGFDGFGASYVTYVPDVCLSYKFMNSAPNEWPFMDLVDACDINFREDVTVVNEVRRNGSSQYVRDATPADKRLRQFLLRCVAEGKFKRVKSDADGFLTQEELDARLDALKKSSPSWIGYIHRDRCYNSTGKFVPYAYKCPTCGRCTMHEHEIGIRCQPGSGGSDPRGSGGSDPSGGVRVVGLPGNMI